MTDSEDEEDYAIFGTPLEQFDEDSVPRKKPLSIEEQVATDKHGRRRFHGAFTGGFSAGFFNSVGSLEGWKPSTFKSSRNERSNVHQQLPLHFMDEEDVEEFGIAPQVLRTKPEYSSSQRSGRKRDRGQSNGGPIPGEPVLKSILKPARHTMGILLLMKMGWKPGDSIGEKLKKKSARHINSSFIVKTKVYGCARGPDDVGFSSVTSMQDESSSDDEEEIYRELGKKAPVLTKKDDTMGLGYKGLDRSALIRESSKSIRPITLRDQFNKTIKISGQAFGVGAFEEEDDDIYSTDDKSQYDFCLEPIKANSKKSKNIQAITDGSNVILGFVRANFKEANKTYPGPIVPASFTGRHVEKKSRFDMAPSGQKIEPQRQQLDANLRASILDPEAHPPTRIKEEILDDNEIKIQNDTGKKSNESNSTSTTSWKPFDSNPAKQERYEKYLNLIKIGAKDLVHTVLENTMSDLERESELREFEGAARLYSGHLMSDRFTHGEGYEGSYDSKDSLKITEKNLRRRLTGDWAPHPVVCKRFNIRPPDNVSGVTLQSVAESSRKPKFSVFDFLNKSTSSNLFEMVETNVKRECDSGTNRSDVECEIISGTSVATIQNSKSSLSEQNFETNSSLVAAPSLLLHADDDDFQEPADKMDLFKAIFLDSDDDDDDDNREATVKETTVIEPVTNSLSENINILRNTSPPRGIFANIDLDKLSNRGLAKDNNKIPKTDVLKLTELPASIFEIDTNSGKESDVNVNSIKNESDDVVTIPENSYGPSLPTTQIEKPKNYVNLKLNVADDDWVEKPAKDISKNKSSEKSKEYKEKRHHKKKHKKEKKKNKHKKKKKRKKYSSTSSSSSDSD